MQDRDRIITELGSMLEQAARASITRGAIYEPGENIQVDATAAWKGVAETLVSLVEAMVKHGDVLRGEVEESDEAT